jgi:hypothetical protein
MTRKSVQPEIRHCGDIGLFAVDRPRCVSCVHATEYCRAHCYNIGIERRFPACGSKDERNELAWRACSGADYARVLARKKKSTERVRLMTRGEAFATVADVERVRDIVTANPGSVWWIPTRAWREPALRSLIEARVATLPNVVVMASLDPSNTDTEWRRLRSAGWSTIYFGNGESWLRSGRAAWHGPTGDTTVRCPKTWRGIKGENACARCKAGCFAPVTRGRRVDVLLQEH